MEEYYGGCLFDRISHKLYITPFGQRIYDYALRLLNLYADMADAKFSFDRLRIGSGTAIGKLFMPTVVKSFLSLYPDIQICVNVGEATRMYHLVMKNALDFVIAEVVDDISGLSHHSIQHFPVVAVCHRSNPLAEKAVVTGTGACQGAPAAAGVGLSYALRCRYVLPDPQSHGGPHVGELQRPVAAECCHGGDRSFLFVLRSCAGIRKSGSGDFEYSRFQGGAICPCLLSQG